MIIKWLPKGTLGGHLWSFDKFLSTNFSSKYMHMEIRWEKVYVDIGAKGLTKTRRHIWVTTRWLRVQMCCIQVKMWSFTIKLLWHSVLFSQAYEKATKEQRMRTEISQAKREANFYIQNVEKGKAIDAIETRKRKRDDQVWCLIVLFLFKKIKNEWRESTHTHYVICWVVAYMAWHCSPRRLERRWWWWCHGDKALILIYFTFISFTSTLCMFSWRNSLG